MYDWFLRIQNVNKDLIPRDKYPQRWACYFDKNIEWYSISSTSDLSEEFMNEYVHCLLWYRICQTQKLSESFIQKHANTRNKWECISLWQDLSEEFIEKYASQVCWESVSSEQDLSESFIEKHKEKVHWKHIYSEQKLSEAFIEKYASNVSWHVIFRYQKMSQPFIEKIIESGKVLDSKCWYNIANCQNVSKKFVSKYFDKWFDTLRHDDFMYFEPYESVTDSDSD